MENHDPQISAKLSDKAPQSAEKRIFSVFDVSRGFSEFINERFRGLAVVNADIRDSGYVCISKEYTAYLFKLILKAVNAEFFIHINISFDGNTLVFDIPFIEDFEIQLRDRAAVFAAASSTDLDIEITKSGIKIFAKSENQIHIMSVYAGNIHEFKSALVAMFFDE